MLRFWILHAAYTSLELVTRLVGIVVTVWITRIAVPAPASAARHESRRSAVTGSIRIARRAGM
jgi:hypothetical protein